MAVFATTLTADCSESDELIYVADNEAARTTYPWRAVIDDEVMYVRAGVAEGLEWLVSRGSDDTDPAAHPTGSILTGLRVGQSETVEALVADDVSPVTILTDETETDVLTSDPEITGT